MVTIKKKKKISGKAIPSGLKNGCMRFSRVKPEKPANIAGEVLADAKFGLGRYHPTGPVSHWEHSLK